MVKGVTLSRSRPYHKNDNRFVEQKNSTLVRAYLGVARFDTAPQTNAINQLYEKMWLYYNFFQPVMRLSEKITQPSLSAQGQPSRIKRRFDQARTPFDRLSETDAISEDRKQQLRTLRDQVNPRQLRQEIHQLIDHHIFLLPPAVPGKTEDVYETLFAPTESQKGEGIRATFSSDWTRSYRGHGTMPLEWAIGPCIKPRHRRLSPGGTLGLQRGDGFPRCCAQCQRIAGEWGSLAQRNKLLWDLTRRGLFLDLSIDHDTAKVLKDRLAMCPTVGTNRKSRRTMDYWTTAGTF
jgi:hypothetical protein